MAVTPSFQLRIAHYLKHWIVNFLSFETTYSMHKLNSRKCSKSGWLSSRMLHVRFLFASPPCIPDLLMAKDFKASVLHVSELSICFVMDSKELSSILDCFGDQITNKNTKTYTIWLELIAKVLNMLIGLKGNNYYSKVFKRVNYKLWNSTFWVVINFIHLLKDSSIVGLYSILMVHICMESIKAL